EKQARTVDVEVELADPEARTRLLPGYSADIEVILESRADALRIPTEAVLEGNRVLVLEADGVLKERHIGPGLRNWRYTEVREGVQAGEAVVVSVDRSGVEPGVRVVAEP
nr:efflux RND transporter periplasmic adaptor subunit [Pseudomonadota bacterium]